MILEGLSLQVVSLVGVGEGSYEAGVEFGVQLYGAPLNLLHFC